METTKDAAQLLYEFLEKEGILLLPAKPKVTFTDDGGIFVQPNFVVRYKDQKEN